MYLYLETWARAVELLFYASQQQREVRERLRVSQLQASGGISTLKSRASGLQSTTQGNSIRTKQTPPSQKKKLRRPLIIKGGGTPKGGGAHSTVCFAGTASETLESCLFTEESLMVWQSTPEVVPRSRISRSAAPFSYLSALRKAQSSLFEAAFSNLRSRRCVARCALRGSRCSCRRS